MRSYREGVAQDADFADGTEAAAWLGFSTRRNPLFLPPKTAANAKKTTSSIIAIDSDQLARLRDAQEFILLNKIGSSSSTSEAPDDGVEGAPTAVEFSGSILPGGGGGGGGGPRRPTIRDRVRAMNSQLATSQEGIRELEDTLRSLEAGRDSDREKVARARGAAAKAGRQKMTQKMYRLRGNAAFLEEGLAELDGEITAVRVRLFAERLVSLGWVSASVIQYHRQGHLLGIAMSVMTNEHPLLRIIPTSSQSYCVTTRATLFFVELGWVGL